MRLLNSTTLELSDFFGRSIPPYAILSHTWGQEEVSFQDMQAPHPDRKIGYTKIKRCCEVAETDGLDYVWIDTCCIDKTSSAELSEAINSMYSWYQRAEICYVFLADVRSGERYGEPGSAFSRSKWFTRGWTLQELIAPVSVIFFGSDWQEIGTKSSLQEAISTITGIDINVLSSGDWDLNAISVAQKMSWVSERETTRPEDIAYCMMGIFDVHMPLLYGEGGRAFTRLQEEIMKVSSDHSLFAWKKEPELPSSDTFSDRYSRLGLLAASPRAFSDSGMITQTSLPIKKHFTSTNKGISLELPLRPVAPGIFCAVLSCQTASLPGRVMGIYLQKSPREDDNFVRMLNCEPEFILANEAHTFQSRHIFVAHDRRLQHTTAPCKHLLIKISRLKNYRIRICDEHFPHVAKTENVYSDDTILHLNPSTESMGLTGVVQFERQGERLAIVLRIHRNLLHVNIVEVNMEETAKITYNSYRNRRRGWIPEPDRIFLGPQWEDLCIVIRRQIVFGNRTHVLDFNRD